MQENIDGFMDRGIMAHHCHATDCQVEVPPEMFMCSRHWFSLPKYLRNKIWTTYRQGQCDDWNISKEYADAARECVTFIANKEGKVSDTSVYDFLEPKE